MWGQRGTTPRTKVGAARTKIAIRSKKMAAATLLTTAALATVVVVATRPGRVVVVATRPLELMILQGEL